MSVIISPAANLDIAESYIWYESQKDGLGELFLGQFRSVVDALELSPLGYQTFDRYHQIPLRQFPYIAVYEIDGEDVVIHAVFHTSQHPAKKTR